MIFFFFFKYKQSFFNLREIRDVALLVRPERL